ncbi:unnamed protein product, partial [Closterium sp. NIES-53]
LWLHQQSYADKLRRHFIDKEQNGCIPKLTFDDKDAQESEEEYQQKVGSLQFVAMTTRPNISFACSKLGSGLVVRSNQHWRKIDRCLAYLSDTRDTALEFGGGAQLLNLVGYVDTDDTGDKQNWTSTGGYVFVFGGAAISWLSKRIKSTGRWDADHPSGGQQVGHHGLRGPGPTGQPQAHGAAICLAAVDGEVREVRAEVHPNLRAVGGLPDKGAALSCLHPVLRCNRPSAVCCAHADDDKFFFPWSTAVWVRSPSVNAAMECQWELGVGLVLAWAEPTSWSGVREVQPSDCSGRHRLGRAD